MRTRLSARGVLARLAQDLSPLQALACAAILFAADWAYRRTGDSFFPGALLDEAAHLLTALLLLQALPAKSRGRVAVPALIASVAIDLDHVPQELGYNFLTVGTPRPYTHSLLTLGVLLLVAVTVRRRRDVFVGLALGVALHFFRDLAEGGGGGISLFWPFSDHAYSYPHPTYLVLMAGVTATDLWLGVLRLRARPALLWPVGRRAES